MPRNGTGVFSIVNPILVGALRSSAAVNANFTDAGAQITNTIPLNGDVGMTGQFRAANGTLPSPGISFDSDRNVGFRRSGTNEMRWVSGGQDRLYVDATGKLWHLGAMDIAGALVVAGAYTGSNDTAAIEALDGTGLARRTGSNTWSLDDGTIEVNFIRDGNGTVLPPGIIGDIRFPFDCTLTSVSLGADQAGSCVVDIWKVIYAQYPPNVGDSITFGGSPPTISGTDKYTDATLSGWVTLINQGDCIRFNLNSCSSITRLTIVLTVKRYP